MASRLLLDECISPSISTGLWEMGVDNYAARDRGLLQAGDHQLFARAIEEDRAIVTINAIHFRKLARAAPFHPGVIVIPSGGSRQEQFEHVTRALKWASAQDPVSLGFRNLMVTVAEDGTVTSEIVHSEERP